MRPIEGGIPIVAESVLCLIKKKKCQHRKTKDGTLGNQCQVLTTYERPCSETCQVSSNKNKSVLLLARVGAVK